MVSGWLLLAFISFEDSEPCLIIDEFDTSIKCDKGLDDLELLEGSNVIDSICLEVLLVKEKENGN